MGFEGFGGGGFDFGGMASSIKDSLGPVMNYVPPIEQPIEFTNPGSVVPPTTDTGGMSFGDIAGKIGSGAKAGLDFAGKSVLPWMGPAATGAGVWNMIEQRTQAAQQNKLAERGLKLQERSAESAAGAAAPLTKFGGDTLQRVTQGQVPPGVQTMIDEWVRAQKARMHQFMASSGQGNSQSLEQMDGMIEQEALGIKQKWIEGQQSQAIAALQGGASALTGAASAAGGVARVDQSGVQDIERLIALANQSMAQMSASGG